MKKGREKMTQNEMPNDKNESVLSSVVNTQIRTLHFQFRLHIFYSSLLFYNNKEKKNDELASHLIKNEIVFKHLISYVLGHGT